MSVSLKRWIGLVPYAGVGAVVLGYAFLSAPGGATTPGWTAALTPAADRVAPAPAGLSTVTTTRDWQEVKGSKSTPKYQP